MSGNKSYLPHKGDIVSVDFNPSSGTEIRKRRPALVISNSKYSKLTGLAVVCPITHADNNKLKKTGMLVKVDNARVDGLVNPLQFHTFDYKAREMKYLCEIKPQKLRQVVQLVDDIINAKEK